MRVLLLGASGMFGKRLATLLAAMAGVQLILAGRQENVLAELRGALMPTACAPIETCPIDLDAADALTQITNCRPDILIDTCGPFQQRDYRLPRLAIAQHFHYIDLADAPEFVAGIAALDREARAAGVLVTAGASSVPALSAAVIDAHRDRFAELHAIDIGITPGNRAERGLATVRSILSGVGKPHAQFANGALTQVPSWSSLRRYRYAAPVGKRWLAYCPVPDALVLPQRYPGLRSLQFRAGLELHRMHFGLWLGGWLVRLHVVHSLAPFAAWAKRLSEHWIDAGTDTGAMHVTLTGVDASGKPLELGWQLIAEAGHGPYVPTAAAATLVRLLTLGTMTTRGAMPCVGLMSLADIALTLQHRAIRFVLSGPW